MRRGGKPSGRNTITRQAGHHALVFRASVPTCSWPSCHDAISPRGNGACDAHARITSIDAYRNRGNLQPVA